MQRRRLQSDNDPTVITFDGSREKSGLSWKFSPTMTEWHRWSASQYHYVREPSTVTWRNVSSLSLRSVWSAADKSESGATGGSEIAQPRLILGPLLAHAAGQQLIICDSEDYFVLMKSRM